jgi:CHAT domain-containing protein
MNLPSRLASFLAGALILAPSPFVAAQNVDQSSLHEQVREKMSKAKAALAKDDLHSFQELQLEVLEIRKKLVSDDEVSDGARELWESYAAIAEVMLDLDPIAGEAYCREALRMRPTPVWRQSAEYASTLVLWGRYLDRLHEGASGEKAMLAALRIYEDHVPNGWSPYLSLCEHYLDHGDNSAAVRLRTMYMKVFPFVTLVASNPTSDRLQVVWITSEGKRSNPPNGSVGANMTQHVKVKAGTVYILVKPDGTTVGATDIEADPTCLQPRDSAGSNFAPPRQAIRFLNACGRFYFNNEDFAAAQMCFAEAAGLGRFAFGKGRVVAESMTYLAAAFLAAGHSQRAFEAAKEASGNLTGTPENGMLEFASDCRLADIYHRLGKPDEASKHAARAEKVRQRSRRIPGHEAAVRSGSPETLRNLGADFNVAEYVGFDPARWLKVQEARKLLSREAMIAEAKSLSERGWGTTYEGNRANANKLFTAALAICEKAYPKSEFPDGHPQLADALSDLATAVEGTLAMQYCEQAMEMRLKVQGPKHPKYAESLLQLGRMLQYGEPSRAETLFKQALDIQREGKSDVGHVLHALGNFYRERSEYAKAAKIYLEAVERARRDPNARVAPWPLNSLGTIYTSWGRLREAEPYLVEALKIRRQILHSNHPDLATSLNSLAALYRAKGQYEDALPLCQEAVAIWSNAPGGQNNNYQVEMGLCALGVTHRSLGNLAIAEECLIQALELSRKAGGNSKSMPVHLAVELAELHSLKGEHAEAAQLSRGAAKQTAVLLKRAAASQPEQGQMSNLASRRRYLDDFISHALASQEFAVDAYDVLMAWKGVVTDGQRLTQLARKASAKGSAATKALFAKLEDVTKRYALQLNGPAHPEKAKLIAALESEREGIEIELTRQTDEFRVLQRSVQVSPSDIRKALPSSAVLIDFLSYARLEKGKRTQSYVAFVVANDGVDWVDLGPAAPIDLAIADFRRGLQRGQFGARPGDPGTLLRDKLWNPIAQKMDGKTLVLISPDRELCVLPFAALPSGDGKRFLLEDVSLAVISMPQLLPEMMAPRSKAVAGEPSLLALGDVDFDAAPGRPSQARAKQDVVASIRGLTGGHSWSHLPGTRDEVLAIESVFNKSGARGKCKLVRQAEATESLFCSEAPLHEYLHVATHGFFADATNEAAEHRHPGLLSGIALAGANRPGTEGDDGILTALEVANLDLSKVKLAVLSACETGLGAATGGEGVVGLQRAFQIAGAQTTVTSLWKVDDEATRKLMERFYENQWKKKLGVLESLREAQLWMLNDGRTVLSESSLRGIARLNPNPERNTDPRLTPHLWAAFVVSGDWR